MSDTLPETSITPSVWRSRLPAIFFLCAVSFLYFRSSVFRAPKHLDLASLDLKTLSGRPLPQSSFQNKAVVLNFWAPWCGPCVVEMPALQRLQTAHSGDLLIVGIVQDPGTYTEAALFAAAHGITYPILRESGAITSAIGAMSTIPVTLYVDRSGKVVHSVTGGISEARMKQYITDTLSH
jgi:thiol-disulfide isomerase/thioredoxin